MFQNIRKRDIFHPGMKYLYGRYCPCCCRDGMQNILASYKPKIKLLKKLLQPSNLAYCPVPLIIPSLITHKQLPQTIKNLKLSSICQAQYQRFSRFCFFSCSSSLVSKISEQRPQIFSQFSQQKRVNQVGEQR